MNGDHGQGRDDDGLVFGAFDVVEDCEDLYLVILYEGFELVEGRLLVRLFRFETTSSRFFVRDFFLMVGITIDICKRSTVDARGSGRKECGRGEGSTQTQVRTRTKTGSSPFSERLRLWSA